MSQETKEKCKETQHKSWPLWAIILTSVATVVSVLLLAYIVLMGVTEEEVKFTLSDWVEIVLPVVGAALVVIFAFLGVDRLKNFDERQDKLENEIREELKHRMEQSDRTISEAKDSMDKHFDSMETSIVKTMLPQAVNDAIEVKISTLKDDVNAEISKLEDITEGFSEKYEDFKNTLENNPALKRAWLDSPPDWNSIQANVNWVHDYVSDLFRSILPDTPLAKITVVISHINSLIAVVCQPKSKITGDADDYHNLASELARNSRYDLAVNVLKKGVQLFPHNIDLLAGIVLFSAKMGQLDLDAERSLKAIPRELWNWRAFTFYIDSFDNRPKTAENQAEVFNAVNQYISLLPHDERAYMAKYEALEHYGKHAEAVATLQEAEATLKMSAQCSLTLCHIYTMCGKFKNAINSANKALLSTAEEQPSANIAAAVARRAFARDALIHEEISKNEIPVNNLASDIQLTIKDYILAKNLGYQYLSTSINNRIKLLQALLVDDANGNSSGNNNTNHTDSEGDATIDSENSDLIQQLLALMNHDAFALRRLLDRLQELSPITKKNHSEYLKCFMDAADGDVEKAKQIQELVEKIFT